MKNIFTFYTLKALQTAAFFVILFSVSLEIKAQKTQNGQANDKSTNNVSTWVTKVQALKTTPPDTTNKNQEKQITASTIKETKVVNPENYFHPEIGKIKLANSPGSVEIIEKRDAQSQTFLNTDGSYTKVSTTTFQMEFIL